MDNQDKKNRIDFLEKQQDEVDILIGMLVLFGDEVASIILRNGSVFGSPSGLSNLLNELSDALLTEKQRTLLQLDRGIRDLARMGVNHLISSAPSGSNVPTVVSLYDINELSTNQIRQIYSNDKSLSDSIWSIEERADVVSQASQLIQKNLSPFQIAENLKTYVTTNRPRYMIDRVANTEYVKAYTSGKLGAAQEYQGEFPDETVMIQLSLSPFHPKYDICDPLTQNGTALYRLDDVASGAIPIPPFHPNCMCQMDTVIEDDKWRARQMVGSAMEPESVWEQISMDKKLGESQKQIQAQSTDPIVRQLPGIEDMINKGQFVEARAIIEKWPKDNQYYKTMDSLISKFE